MQLENQKQMVAGQQKDSLLLDSTSVGGAAAQKDCWMDPTVKWAH